MPIPDYGLYDKDGKQILNRDPRFNHRWYASTLLIPCDNESQDDYPSLTNPPNYRQDEAGLLQDDSMPPIPDGY